MRISKGVKTTAVVATGSVILVMCSGYYEDKSLGAVRILTGVAV